MTRKNSIAAIVAHPDDEVLAFGGTLARHAGAGEAVHILIMATGVASRGGQSAAAIHRLRDEARKAARIIGAKSVEFGDFPDNKMDSAPLLEVVKSVEAFLARTTPTVVYTHHAGDINIDHGVVARAVLTACRPLPGSRIERVYAGEVLSSSEYADPDMRFRPTTYVDIGRQIEKKAKALGCYKSELRPWPHPRSLEAVHHQAALRGTESGLNAAEALRLLREIRRA